MTPADTQKPLCPVCRRADQVKTLQAASDAGVRRLAPPPLPVGQTSMMRYIIIGVGIIAVCSFFIIVLLGNYNLLFTIGGVTIDARIIELSITFLGIVFTLVISFIGFARVVAADMASQERLPAYDRALANWSRLRYCARDNVVFDPEQVPLKPLTDEAYAALIAMDPQHGEKVALPAAGATATQRQ